MTTTTIASNVTAPTQLLEADDATYAYRRFGDGPALPLLCLQHFIGTLDNWDPAVTDPLASGRERGAGRPCSLALPMAGESLRLRALAIGAGGAAFPLEIGGVLKE